MLDLSQKITYLASARTNTEGYPSGLRGRFAKPLGRSFSRREGSNPSLSATPLRSAKGGTPLGVPPT